MNIKSNVVSYRYYCQICLLCLLFNWYGKFENEIYFDKLSWKKLNKQFPPHLWKRQYEKKTKRKEKERKQSRVS